MIFTLVSLVLWSVLCDALTFNDAFPILQDIRSRPVSNWTVEDYVTGFGYPIETHKVTTEQGYILTLHRIPYGKNGPSIKRPVMYIQHGLFVNSASWLVLGPDNAIGFVCADAGYDVWIGNARGTTLSGKHVTIDPDTDPKNFFDFTFHEMGQYDLPSIIDYILLSTGQTKLTYVGHSMGTSMFFVFLSQRPEYNSKIKVACMLSPIAYLQGSITAIGLRPFETFYLVAGALGIYEIFSYKQFREFYDLTICGLSANLASFCNFMTQVLGEIITPNNNSTVYPTLFESIPAGTTTKVISHFAQLSLPFTEFKQFDYGVLLNFERYGVIYPPLYPLWEITCPLYFYYGSNDILTPDYDMYQLASKFSTNLLSVNKVDGYGHFNFWNGNDVKSVIYDKIIQQDTAIN